MAGRPYILHEATYEQLKAHRPVVAVLPWGATEAHNYHLPHGTDVIEASTLAADAAGAAHAAGARVVVLPAIPFGNNAQQLDQVATISFGTETAAAILDDVVESLLAQGIDRLVILNAHGGNDFKPIVRDAASRGEVLVVVVNFWQLAPEVLKATFDDPGDHAGEMETSFLMHVTPDLVDLPRAGEGKRLPFAIEALNEPGVWTPRPWSAVHPDTGSGNPAKATAAKGKAYFDAASAVVARLLVELAAAKKGDVPYL
jgi:creatinine amidohydrolase